MVDQEKSIQSTHMHHMEHAKFCVDPLYVKKHFTPGIGPEKVVGIALYYKSVHAPNRTKNDSIKRNYGPKTTSYLSKFADAELYRS